MKTIYDSAYHAGTPFSRFLAEAEANRPLWHSFADRATLPEDAAARLEGLQGCWRLLVLADEWCGDAVNTLPVVARLAEASENVDLRVVPRDAHPRIRDRHLANGSRSIPIVVLLDERGEPRGSWGPRPGPLQARFERELRALPKDERYREIRRWYARDRGATTAREVARMIVRAAAAAPGGGQRPCIERLAA